ncbi:MAG: hypothetical protein AB1758_31065, partial [Candidatus Eremiobacterota bacterium]
MDELKKLRQLEGVGRAEDSPEASVSALNLGLASARLGGAAPPLAVNPSLDAVLDSPATPDEGDDLAPGLNLMAFMDGLSETEEVAPPKATPEPPSVWTRPVVARALAVGGLLAGCAAGALALGPAGLLLTMAAE